jgi:hypothetical protein
MPFDNFYKEFDKAERRWRWLLFCSIIFLPAVYLTVPVIYSSYSWYENYKPEVTEEQAQRERHVDALCMSLPKPEQFNFVDREPFFSSAKVTTVTFNYRSERVLEEMMPTFRVWFEADGWTADAGWKSKFSKGDQTILIQSAENNANIFEIWCSERDPNSPSFEIYD